MPDESENTRSAAKLSPLAATERQSPSDYMRAWHDAINRCKEECPEKAADFEDFRAYLPKLSP